MLARADSHNRSMLWHEDFGGDRRTCQLRLRLPLTTGQTGCSVGSHGGDMAYLARL